MLLQSEADRARWAERCQTGMTDEELFEALTTDFPPPTGRYSFEYRLQIVGGPNPALTGADTDGVEGRMLLSFLRETLGLRRNLSYWEWREREAEWEAYAAIANHRSEIPGLLGEMHFCVHLRNLLVHAYQQFPTLLQRSPRRTARRRRRTQGATA